jgi:hypothetical protein
VPLTINVAVINQLFAFSFVTCCIFAALRKSLIHIITITAFTFICNSIAAQVKVKGHVYDSSRLLPVQSVSVIATNGKGTITNSEGFYELEVREKDSIYFSYLGKPTVKFPVAAMINPLSFDISLQINIPTLAEVKIRPRNYKLDSLQNRLDYAKVFNYKKPGLRPSVTSGGVGFDVNEIINMFRFKRNKSLAAFQKRLLQEERDKFIDNRFSKRLVSRLTKIPSNELDSFMREYRPSYTFTKLAGDYDFQLYIKKAYERYKKGLGSEFWYKQEEEEEQ